MAALATAGILGSGCVIHGDSNAFTAREEKKFQVTGTPELNLTTFDGSIEVRTWDRNEVLVEIEKRASTKDLLEKIEIKADQTGDRITVEARQPHREGGLFGHWSLGARLIASVPRRTNVMARSGDGAVDVDGVTGRVEARTGDGSVRAYRVAGDIRAHTGDGAVTLESVDGTIDVTTGDGSIRVDGKLASLRVRTGDGAVTVRAAAGSAMTDDWDVATGDGGVSVTVPSSFNAEVDLHTGDGRVRAEGVSTQNEDTPERRTVKGRLGSGGKMLKVRSGDGSIELRSN